MVDLIHEVKDGVSHVFHRRSSQDSASDQPDKNKDAVIAVLLEETRALRDTVTTLQKQVHHDKNGTMTYYSSAMAVKSGHKLQEIPKRGLPAKFVAGLIEDIHLSDFNPRLNTSSYVNVVSEEEEKRVAQIGAEINIADASVYPASIELHDKTVNMIANLWHCPKSANSENFSGAGTVGSTEACLLAGLALKFRWRKWYAARHGLTQDEVLAIRPNLVMSSCYQAAWEKLFRYFDIEAKLVKPNLQHDKMAIDAKELVALCDEKTIACVGILGNHYNGMYDPIWDIDCEVGKLNKEKGWQIGVHVDAASGGFIAPFQEMSGKGTPEPWDFRLPNVLTISSSGHKFGESICGTGWIVFRQREDLAEHIAVTVTYLGGSSDSLTLNFSRPASGPYVQFYKLLRLGKEGYQQKVDNQMEITAYIRHFIKNLVHAPSGKKRFQMLDGGDTRCLPVVAARLNPELGLHYTDIDMQHALSEAHWYVSGYSLGFEDPSNHNEELEDLFTDVDKDDTMFRIVVKSNLTMGLAEDLTNKLEEVLEVLDSMDEGYMSLRTKANMLRELKEEGGDAATPLPNLDDKRQVMKNLHHKSYYQSAREVQSKRSAMVSQHIC